MPHSRKPWTLTGLLLVLGAFSANAFADSDPGCPEGFKQIPSGLACAAADMAGPDGTFPGVIWEAPAGDDCAEGFERPLGVNFCIAENLTVNATRDLPILEWQTSRLCPEGFHRQPGSHICVASNLVLAMQRDGSAKLGSTSDCPTGFYRPVGSTVCVAGTMQGSSTVLENPVGPFCPPGFHRPPGVTVCIPKNLIYGRTAPFNVAVPKGECPKHWHRPAGVQFCIPSHEQANAGGSAGIVLGFTQNLCPVGTYEVWFDVPVYDDEHGWFIVDYIPTRFCVPEDLQPAG